MASISWQKIPTFLKGLSALSNPRTWGPFTDAYDTSRFDHGFTISWSQGGEDIALLQLIGEKKGRYLDIGAHHPTRFSVTRHLYQRGWRGVHVDANANLEDAFQKQRPDEVFVHACVGTLAEYSFKIFDEPALSTSNNEWAERQEKLGNQIVATQKVKGLTAKKLIEDYGPFNLIIIDAEGSDEDVILSMSLEELSENLMPDFLLVETSPPVSTIQLGSTAQYLAKFNYHIAVSLTMSTIFKRNL